MFNHVRDISAWLSILVHKFSDEFADHALLVFRNGLVDFAHFLSISNYLPLQVPYRHYSLGLAVSGFLDINAIDFKFADLAIIAADVNLFRLCLACHPISSAVSAHRG